MIRHHFDPVQAAKDYRNYATAISVLAHKMHKAFIKSGRFMAA
ncbi:MAG: hypothetical protein AB8W37_02700 [Arsenophonus endosymbiont of Dermacentor nuttalli]